MHICIRLIQMGTEFFKCCREERMLTHLCVWCFMQFEKATPYPMGAHILKRDWWEKGENWVGIGCYLMCMYVGSWQFQKHSCFRAGAKCQSLPGHFIEFHHHHHCCYSWVEMAARWHLDICKLVKWLRQIMQLLPLPLPQSSRQCRTRVEAFWVWFAPTL